MAEDTVVHMWPLWTPSMQWPNDDDYYGWERTTSVKHSRGSSSPSHHPMTMEPRRR